MQDSTQEGCIWYETNTQSFTSKQVLLLSQAYIVDHSQLINKCFQYLTDYSKTIENYKSLKYTLFTQFASVMGSLKNARQKLHASFQRPSNFQNLLYSDILTSQQTDTNGDLADTLLICHGGTIRVHAFILQAASQFIQNAIASQGENYPFTREILLPDFPVKDIERMVSLIYKGYVDLRSDRDVQNLQDTLKFFQVSGVDFSYEDNKFTKIKGSLKIQELNRIPQDIFKKEVYSESAGSSPAVVIEKVTRRGGKTEEPSTSSQLPLRRSGRAPKPIITKTGNEDDSDYKAESSAEDGSDDEDQSPRKRKGGPAKYQPVVKLPRLGANQTVAVTSTTTVSTINQNQAPEEEEKEDSGTDTEDEDWVEPNFKDKKWFAIESRRCQSCFKTFEKPAHASLCVTSHKCLRCYFCFKVYSTTDILFKHFKRRHKQAGRENTLICPFCDQAIPFKSVSCHVISVHLTKRSNDFDFRPGGGGGNRVAAIKAPVRTPATVVAGSSSTGSQKKGKGETSGGGSSKQLKLTSMSSMKKKESGELKVADLDITIEKKTVFGTTLTFRLQKIRPIEID